MLSLNDKIENYECSFDEQDINDMQDIILIGKVAWSPREKKTVVHPDVPVYRIYSTYDPNNTSNVSPHLKNARYFPLQPSFYRCCASAGNPKLTEFFDYLIKDAIKLYDKPFSTVSCILSDRPVEPHVHFVDPNKTVITTTYYWTLTKNPINAEFVIEDEVYPMHSAGKLEFDPKLTHGVRGDDGNMRFYVLIDNL